MKPLLAALLLAAAPAHADPVGAIDHEGGRTVLYDDAGPCQGGAHRAEFRPEDGGAPIAGCWRPTADGEGIAVVLLDVRSKVFRVESVGPVKTL